MELPNKEKVDTLPEQDSEALSARLDKLEVQLIEQDHRLFRVVTRYISCRRTMASEDPRRAAALHALIYCLFFSSGAVAITGGIVAAATLAVLIWQNILLVEQNTLVRDQLSRQVSASIAAQRSEIVNVLFESESDGVPKYSARARREAVLAFVVLERSRDPEAIADLSGALLNKVDLTNADLYRVILQNANLTGSQLNGANLQFSDLRGANMEKSYLEGTNLQGAQLVETNLQGAWMMDANLGDVTLEGADLRGSVLDGATLNGATYNESTRWPDKYVPDLHGASLGK